MSKSQAQPWTIARNPMPADPAQPLSTKKKAAAKPRLAAAARWLHIYLSMVSFAIILFFAVTGLTLNHVDWFDDQSSTTEFKGKVSPAFVNQTDTAKINKLAVVEFLRNTHGIKGAMDDFRIDERQCSISFRGPGYAADAFVDRSTGAYQLTETRMGLVAVMNDLHKGRDTGNSWSLVIDIAAIFMTLVSATGLVLILFLKKKRFSGLVWAGIGALVCYLIYYFWVA
ncbi:PepSY-associated TM helix domain-containing protein [Spirosoma pollinicola]|uniref:Peptidase n=1 Tax=Spirosoma pollinicola TaxID=2057025 RepID=A0A2K8Z363_9BACT|nr:PepSY-associated TM helix domain-containing protein [Spirosoma pollinicola]AUD04279.1 peptidase [Spirosoma pollinicola]